MLGDSGGPTVGSYEVIETLADVMAWKDMMRETPNLAKRKFLYRLSR